MLAGHGIICWGDTAKGCYENTVGLIADAARYLNERLAKRPAFGGQVVKPRAAADRRAIAARLMPKLRGLMVGARTKVGHFSDDPEALEFAGSRDFERLAAIGTSCPDHFLRTKIAPLTLDTTRLDEEAYLAQRIETYRKGYEAYYQRCATAEILRCVTRTRCRARAGCRPHHVRDRQDHGAARGEFYGNAINVMRGAEALGGMSASTSWRPSASSTGRSKRPSCVACRHRSRSSARSRSSPALRVGLARPPHGGCLRPVRA
jgi:rhamnose utilization protein RhaD (predicted bifunctional aldolase and dehydrogenase)